MSQSNPVTNHKLMEEEKNSIPSVVATPVEFKRVIACLGAGYVGGPSMAVMALNCPDVKVIVVDLNAKRIERWNSSDLDNLPIYEPGLQNVIKQTRQKNLFFTTDLVSAVQEASMIFVSVNTPTKTHGIGAGKAADLRYWEAAGMSNSLSLSLSLCFLLYFCLIYISFSFHSFCCEFVNLNLSLARSIAQAANGPKIVIEKSTLPVRSTLSSRSLSLSLSLSHFIFFFFFS